MNSPVAHHSENNYYNHLLPSEMSFVYTQILYKYYTVRIMQ